ncbi:MAG: hypothetical protein V7727_02895 [Sneathiella sp.]
MFNVRSTVFTIFCVTACLAGVLHASDASAATSKACLNTRVDPQVIFTLNTVKTTVNLKKSSSQITSFAKKISAYTRGKGQKLLGLAYTEMRSGMGVEINGARFGKRTCISLRTVKFSFERVHSEIFVAKKYKPGTCAYKAVLAHEREHMAINAKVQGKYEAKLKQKVIVAVKKVKPYFASKPKKEPKRLIRRLNAELSSLMAQFDKERKKLNGRIDTSKSYAKVHRKCTKW